MAEQTFHESIIDEFRGNGGVVTRPYPDSTLVLVTMQGARTGRRMTRPLEYLELDGVLHIFATASGAPENPAWYHNLLAHPDVAIEVPGEADLVSVHAEELTGQARDEAWEQFKSASQGFRDYEQKTSRTIPVLILHRR